MSGLVLLLNPRSFPAVTGEMDFSRLADKDETQNRDGERHQRRFRRLSALGLFCSFNPFGFEGFISKSIQSLSNTINNPPPPPRDKPE